MLKFSEWEKIYYHVDESVSDDVQNWVSRLFGGKISKIDGIVSDLYYIEKEFVKEWEKVQMEISSMENQIEKGEISSEERESFEEKIKAKNNEIDKLEKLRSQKVKALNLKVRDYTGDNQRAIKYWNLKKAETEVEIAKMMYDLAKNLPNKRMGIDLYKDYVEAEERLKNSRSEVGQQVKSDSGEEPKTEEKSLKGEIPSARELASMSSSRFYSEVSSRDKDSLRKIKKILVEQKNEALNELRILKRNKLKELDDLRSGKKEEILSRYNPKIYKVGEFIDRMREKINYIDAKLNN